MSRKRSFDRLRPSAVLVVALCGLVLPRAAAAHNLLINPSFDTSLAGWLTNAAISWTGSEGHRALGAARFLHTTSLPAGGSSTVTGQCVPVVSGESYDFGGSVRFAPGQHPTVSAQVFVSWEAQADCLGANVGSASTNLAAASTSWQEVRALGKVAPAGARAAAVLLIVSFGAPTTLHGFWDDIYLGTCLTTAFALCLGDTRFRVTADWRTPDADHGIAEAVQLTEDSGYFFFFNPTNPELFVKVNNACVPAFNRFWVFVAGLTNVRVDLKVVDTETGEIKTYLNPLNRAFQPIQDTDAFATCP